MTQFFLTLMFGAVQGQGPGPGVLHNHTIPPNNQGKASVYLDQHQHHPLSRPSSADIPPWKLCNSKFFHTISSDQTGVPARPN